MYVTLRTAVAAAAAVAVSRARARTAAAAPSKKPFCSATKAAPARPQPSHSPVCQRSSEHSLSVCLSAAALAFALAAPIEANARPKLSASRAPCRSARASSKNSSMATRRGLLSAWRCVLLLARVRRAGAAIAVCLLGSFFARPTSLDTHTRDARNHRRTGWLPWRPRPGRRARASTRRCAPRQSTLARMAAECGPSL